MTSRISIPAIPDVRRRWSLRAVILGLGFGAVAYVAVIGALVAFRIGPAASRLESQSADVIDAFVESRARVDALDSALTDMWRHLGEGRIARVPIDTLERLRLRLQQLAVRPSRRSHVLGASGAPPDLRAALANAGRREEIMYMSLTAAIAALERQNIPGTERMLRHADSAATPLNDAIGDATAIALRDVNRHENRLAAAARYTSTLVLIWLIAGIAAVPLLAWFLRVRLYRPLAAMDAGLARVASGDLSTRFNVEHDDELGRLGGHFNHMTAVLRQRAQEEEQRMVDHTAARTRRILDAALDAVAVVDTSGIVREWNPQAEAIFGWRRDEVLGRPIAEQVFHRKLLAAYKSDILAGKSLILNQRVETVAARRDGTVIPVELAITPLSSGDQIEFSVFVRDISDRHKAQAALAESEARYRAAFEQAAVGVIELDSSGTFMHVNTCFARMLGYEADQLVGRRFADLTHADDTQGDERAFHSLFAEEVPSVQREKRYLRKDGAALWVHITSALVRDSSGAKYAVAVIQDLSERKRLENDLVQVQKMDAVGRLAGGIAHDFNNLLSGIMGYADLLHHADDATPRTRADAGAIINTAQRGADLAQNLLALARRTPSRAERVDLNEVILELKELVSRTFDRRVELRLQLSSDPAIVIGDRSHLSNALLNLAVNGRDAMPQGGRLTFTSRRVTLTAAECARHAEAPLPGEYVAVSVADTGVGIPPATLARIFEPFFTTKEAGKGTGLGLAMVYGTVRSHNGIIEVASEPGAGATFTMFFPRVDAASQPAPAAAAPSLVMGEGRILLADDETIVREVATRMIERLGYTVDAVADGALAVERVRANPLLYQVVILDGDMPQMSGREAARLIRALLPGIPILLATGYLSPEGSEPLESYGFSAGIGKPYTLSALSRMLGGLRGDAS